MNAARTLLLVSIALAPLSAAQVASGTVDVPGAANLYGAGHAAPPAPGGGGGGVLPVEIALPAGAGRELRLSGVDGQISYGSGLGSNGADGLPFGACANVSLNGIAGCTSTQIRFLAGVFLDGAEPADPSPPELDFVVLGTDFTALAPGLRQSFFLGDGIAQDAGGAVQVFHVPDGATRLFLGYFDSCCCGGAPGAYGDNSGELEVGFEVCVAQGSQEVPRLGSPPNAAGSLLPGATSGPVIGATWDPAIQPGHLTGAVAGAVPVSDVLALGAAANLPFPSLGGTVLVDLLSPLLVVSTAPGTPFAVPVPVSCDLVGEAISAQGVSLGIDGASGVARLTSGLDLVVGTF